MIVDRGGEAVTANRAFWAQALVPDRPRAPARGYLGFAVPLRLRSDGGELRLEAFLPADDATAAEVARVYAPHRVRASAPVAG